MNTIVNFVSGKVLAPVWSFLDGKKTAIASSLSILAGVTGLSAEVAPLLAAHNTAALLELVKHLPSDPAYLAIVGGLGALGIGHKIDKAAQTAAPVAAPVALGA
jgi:hypothetical protein